MRRGPRRKPWPSFIVERPGLVCVRCHREIKVGDRAHFLRGRRPVAVHHRHSHTLVEEKVCGVCNLTPCECE